MAAKKSKATKKTSATVRQTNNAVVAGDWRNVLFSIIVAILFAFLVFTSIDAFYPQVNYSDYCPDDLYQRNPYARQAVENFSDPQYVAQIEAFEREQRACNEAYSSASAVRNFAVFIFSSLLGLIVIIVAFYLPNKQTFHIMLANGLLLGGLIVLFVGTVANWSSIAMELRPFVILLELVIVVVVAWQKLNNKTFFGKRK